MGRRRALQGIVSGVGASLAIPGLAAEHPVHAHLADTGKMAEADAKAEAAGWKPAFLDTHQFETLSSLAEHILPGAKKLKADRFIDQLVAVDSQENQRRFLTALGAMEGDARARFGKPWKALPDAQQIEALTAASTMERGKDTDQTLGDHFEHLKGWVVGAYYSTEEGMRDLGWTGRQFFESYPGCDHADGHR